MTVFWSFPDSKASFGSQSPWVTLRPWLAVAWCTITYVPTLYGPSQFFWIFFSVHKEITISWLLFLYWPLNVAVPSIVMQPFPWAKVSLGNMTQIYIQERVNSVTCPVKSVDTFRRRVLLMPNTLRRATLHGVTKSQTRLSDWTATKSTLWGLSGKEPTCQCGRHGFDP